MITAAASGSQTPFNVLEERIDVSGPVQNADDIHPVFRELIKDQPILEACDRQAPEILESRIAKRA
jgi:hypothetical protein